MSVIEGLGILVANGLEFPPPVRYLSTLLDIGPDPVAGDVWVGDWWALGLNPSLGFLCFLGRVTVGCEVGDTGAWVFGNQSAW